MATQDREFETGTFLHICVKLSLDSAASAAYVCVVIDCRQMRRSKLMVMLTSFMAEKLQEEIEKVKVTILMHEDLIFK